jgi:SAM-dependent MidA family methyltransferase
LKHRTTSLAERLRDRIERNGPISFRDWMQAALYDDSDGYYCNEIRQGRAGDYRTAPETSALFGATFARYFAKLFVELGAPRPFTIVEAGGGAGEFARAALGALRSYHPELYAATKYAIEEIGDFARAQCAARLSEFGDRVILKRPHETAPGNPAPQIIFSNELIDAFPVHRVTKRGDKLLELGVGVKDERFAWVESEAPARLAEYCDQAQINLAEGQIAEINLAAETFVAQVASRLRNGFLITVDYGDERSELLNDAGRRHGTLRGFYRHQIVDDVLSHVGHVDLTTTIDWTQLREAGDRAQLETVRQERLDQFLLAEGALEVLEETAAELNSLEALRLRTSAREMLFPHRMAASFQVLVQRKQDAAAS